MWQCYTTVLLWFQKAPALVLSTGSPSVSSFSSGECGNAILQYCYGFNRLHLWFLAQGLLQSVNLSLQVSILQYCYGFNRLQLWLLAQGLLQSVLSLQVSVAMPYYSIVMVSIYRRQLWLLAQGLLQSILSLQVSVTMPYYSIVMVSIYRRQLWLLAQGLLQSILSLQVSHTTVLLWCQLWLSLLAQGLLQSVPSLQVSAWGNAIL